MPDLGPHTCAMCPKMCRFACPVARATGSEGDHPTGIASGVISGRPEAAYACTLCGGCSTPCELDQDVRTWIVGARQEAVALGRGVSAWCPDNPCCGAVHHEMGYEDEAQRLRAAFPELDAHPEPRCAAWLGVGWRAAGALADGDGRRAIYHDTCVFARHERRWHDAPRELAARVYGELLEFPHNRERARCCGAGGGLPLSMPDAARAMAEERVTEAREAGAELIVTASPMCAAHLDRPDLPAVSM